MNHIWKLCPQEIGGESQKDVTHVLRDAFGPSMKPYQNWSQWKGGCQDAIRKEEKKGKKADVYQISQEVDWNSMAVLWRGWIWVWTFWLKLSRLLHSTVVIYFFLDLLRKNEKWLVSHNLNHYIRWIEK